MGTKCLSIAITAVLTIFLMFSLTPFWRKTGWVSLASTNALSMSETMSSIRSSTFWAMSALINSRNSVKSMSGFHKVIYIMIEGVIPDQS
uniref:Uncharacterized protein n=1 Tax=Babesia bovis TaxID=5865 RepID=S6C8B6_BABBO|nr:hypothetical protein [Babesia bovis]